MKGGDPGNAFPTPPRCPQRNLRKGPSGLADEINFEDFLTIMAYFQPIDTTMDEEQVQLCRREKLRCAFPCPFGSWRVGRAEDTSPIPWEVSPSDTPCAGHRGRLSPPESSHGGLLRDTPQQLVVFWEWQGAVGNVKSTRPWLQTSGFWAKQLCDLEPECEGTGCEPRAGSQAR